MAARYEYKVEEIREGMLGGKMSGDKLEGVLNEAAGEGWQLKAITAVEVKGRVGPGGVEGVLVTFERPVACRPRARRPPRLGGLEHALRRRPNAYQPPAATPTPRSGRHDRVRHD